MKNIFNTIQFILTAIGAYLGLMIGGWDGFSNALVTFVIIDYITGVMAAIIEKRLSSDVGARGIFKKVLIFCLVAVGHIIDTKIIGSGSVVRSAVIFFYLSNEGISIVENAGKIGLPIPQKLKDILEQLKGDEEHE